MLCFVVPSAGSNGHEFMFLLKGHEDLRQDERVMQLFGLVNTLLANDPASLRKNLRYKHTHTHLAVQNNSGSGCTLDGGGRSKISVCCLHQHPALCRDPSVHQLGPDWVGAPLRHPARPYQRLQRKEEDSAQHWASHHAEGEEPAFVLSFQHRGPTFLICLHLFTH